MNTDRLDLALSPNRAEEFAYDVTDRFVLPSFYSTSDLKYLQKPRVIIGGRGCGKTMLLRYLSHETSFSQRRASIPEDELRHIGLYWRVDTQFAALLTERGLPGDVWSAAFGHAAALLLSAEALRSCRSIAMSTLRSVRLEDVEALHFERLAAFDEMLTGSFAEVERELEQKLWAFQLWANNVRTSSTPVFLPATPFMRAVIGELLRQLPALTSAGFFVYIDEYENLLDYQQEIVNTWLKHSEAPLIFNVATKRAAMRTRSTVGAESIVDIHDFRVYDLEALESDFDVFAAEVLFQRLGDAVPGNPTDVDLLRNPAAVRRRRTPEYTARVRKHALALLPQETLEQIAEAAVLEESMARRLLARTSQALTRRRSELPAAAFLPADLPAAAVLSPVLLSRAGLTPEAILVELEALRDGAPNRFTGRTGWIHNNLFGALLQLYDPVGRPCPLYAGFERFAALARSNLRHFLELCHKALERTSVPDQFQAVDTAAQAEAARVASTAFLAEVKSFGRKGSLLHAFVLRLGSLFALAHQRRSLSEPEQNHFVIARGRVELGSDIQSLLTEAVKWSVLYEESGTKKKSPTEPESMEYVLNPIYAPYFHISYRKKRRLELSSDDFMILAAGSYDEMRDLTSRYARKWGIEGSEASTPLFAHLLQAR